MVLHDTAGVRLVYSCITALKPGNTAGQKGKTNLKSSVGLRGLLTGSEKNRTGSIVSNSTLYIWRVFFLAT